MQQHPQLIKEGFSLWGLAPHPMSVYNNERTQVYEQFKPILKRRHRDGITWKGDKIGMGCSTWFTYNFHILSV